MKDTRITIRLESTQRDKIQKLVSDGHYKNLAEAIRSAMGKLVSEENWL